MKNNIKFTFFIVFVALCNISVFSQHGCHKTVNGSLSFDGSSEQSQNVSINTIPEGCVGSSLGIDAGVPNWAIIDQNGDYITVTCLPNNTGACRSTEVFFNDGTNNPFIDPSPRGSIKITQTTTNIENINWIQNEQRDINGKVISKSRNYFDILGKNIQAQSVDIKTGKTWVSQTMYDSNARPALQTLDAPTDICTIGGFQYKDDFVMDTNNNPFTKSSFETSVENPSEVANNEHTVGWYYSESNTDQEHPGNSYQDKTTRPYSRTIYSELNPGTVLKTIGGNKIDNEWKNGYTFSMPVGQELSQQDAFNNVRYNSHKIIKTVSRDVHGIENVVFTDTDGNTLATARSGNEEDRIDNNRVSKVAIGEQGYVDVHIPVGRTGIQLEGHALIPLDIYNLITEEKITISSRLLPNGFYRIAVRETTNYIANTVKVQYPENYYDYSLNEYDKAGRLKNSKQPLNHLESIFNYNSLGQLENTTSPDEGDTKFKYRKDGQIRYSQNSKQAVSNQISYTNYDDLGRPIESGLLTGLGPINIDLFDPDRPIHTGIRSEQHFTVYDEADHAGLMDLVINEPRIGNYHENQNFVAGNVAKTYILNQVTVIKTSTWYSYDIYGRVIWMVQKIEGLDGAKTIDYEYDEVSGQVTKVYYQKHHPTEQFIHRYTYDPDDYSLVKVETSTNDSNYTEHAVYDYYETGALKRLNLAQGLQGIDYVYNLNGALKSINHPNLNNSSDPGGDSNDLFGMSLHYYQGDYLRNTPTPVPSMTSGINQYNGNIKAIETNTNRTGTVATPNTYHYRYNRNNWMTDARYDYQGNFDEQYNATETFSTVIPTNTTEKQKATQKITWSTGFKATEGSYVNARIVPEGTSDGDYDVSGISYDANGNIQSLYRNKNEENGSNAMDQLSYTYKTDKPNQLLRVNDAVGDVVGADDIGDQSGENYEYNSIGQLVKNNEENISYLYNASGLVTQVNKDNQPLVKFFYNDKGHRVRKESYTPSNGNLSYTEHYVRDAAGTPMAIYRDGTVVENTIYGASRLGVRKSDGNHLYQLTDHLGNVRAVVSRTSTGQAMALTSATDYYPFGMPMPGRDLKGDYRYAYQGQEVDPETGKEAFELRLWDSRIGRWLTTDPYGQYYSPYLGMGNNPISMIDPDGGMSTCTDAEGNSIPCDSVNQTYTNAENNLDEVWISNKFEVKEDWLNSMHWESHWSGFSDNFNAGWASWDQDGVANFWMDFASTTIGNTLMSFGPLEFIMGASQVSYGPSRAVTMTRKSAEVIGSSLTMRRSTVYRIAKEAGIGLKGVRIKFLKGSEFANAPFVGVAYKNTIALTPQAFKNTSELIKTLAHERTHIMQFKIFGEKFVRNGANSPLFEEAAYGIENTFINFWKNAR
ncbi:RHS repeat-associated core domain-containing protein [Aquimarina sp. 2201CG1-2-11]|uniref:RHS repeat domain-containing protein n=1 Tax=Aquimarina discodermiae TaxID=3231043 RepID=UPI00346371AD